MASKRKKDGEPKGSSVQLKTFKKWGEEPKLASLMEAIVPEIRHENDTDMVIKVRIILQYPCLMSTNHVLNYFIRCTVSSVLDTRMPSGVIPKSKDN